MPILPSYSLATYHVLSHKRFLWRINFTLRHTRLRPTFAPLGLILPLLARPCLLVARTESQLGSFGWVKNYLFPVWFMVVGGIFLVLETRKQARRFFSKGAASVCGVMSIVNEFHNDSVHKVDGRLIPRTMDLPAYSVPAFNDKVNEVTNVCSVDGTREVSRSCV